MKKEIKPTSRESMDKDLLKKYLENTCSDAELAAALDAFKDPDKLPAAAADWAKEIWDQESEDAVDETIQSSILGNIHHTIEKKHKTIKWTKGFNYLYRIAAVLLVPVFIYTLIATKHYKKQAYASAMACDSLVVNAPIGSKAKVKLADGTIVHLNNESTLKYPSKFTGDTRKVELEGEAYFEVAHNPAKPFIVSFNQINVKAVGTEFNVMAYPEEQIIQTTLVQGKVILERKNGGLISTIGNMIPNQQVSFNKETENITSNMVDVTNYTGWQNGFIVFNNESILSIQKKLERMYNVSIHFKDEEAKQYTYQTTLVNPDLNEILDLIQLATPVHYEVIEASDTNEKKQIVISSNE